MTPWKSAPVRDAILEAAPARCRTMAWRRTRCARRPHHSAYLAGCRPTSEAIGSFFLKTTLLLDDITFVSKAMWTTMVANAFDMNVSTSGSLLSRLSHQRNGLSTQPPSKVATLPS